jgi:hypothetical protein
MFINQETAVFEATKDTPGEQRKAWYKNHNLPTLIQLWSGPRAQELQCAITGEPAFSPARCRVTGREKLHFDIDFNHIRQEHDPRRRTGVSKDKTSTPSDLFRTYSLENNPLMLIEFVTMMPVSPTMHKHISTDSRWGDITLKNYSRSEWPWCLRTQRNWRSTQQRFPCLCNISYAWIRDHLEQIDHPQITARLRVSEGKLVIRD